MNEYIYEKMNSVTVKNNDKEYIFNYISDFEEYDHEIVIESGIQIDGLIRGFVGDLFYRAKGYSVVNDNKEVTTATCFKEVLLARITISAQPGHAIVWRYTFLKD